MELFVNIFGVGCLITLLCLMVKRALMAGFLVYTISQLSKEVQREQNKLIDEMLGE